MLSNSASKLIYLLITCSIGFWLPWCVGRLVTATESGAGIYVALSLSLSLTLTHAACLYTLRAVLFQWNTQWDPLFNSGLCRRCHIQNARGVAIVVPFSRDPSLSLTHTRFCFLTTSLCYVLDLSKQLRNHRY